MKREVSRKVIQTVDIEDYYEKVDGEVYHIWRFAGKADKKWNRDLTPYKEIPVVYLNIIKED
jgi:hypothetical protein